MVDGNKKNVTPQQTECDNTVNACIAIIPPPGFTVDSLGFAPVGFNANLACHLGAPFPTACTTTLDECPPITGTFEVIPVYLTGCIDVIISLAISGNCPGGEGTFFSASQSIPVNNVVCLASATSNPACTQDQICPIVDSVTVEPASATTPCSVTGYVANVVFILPCPVLTP